MSTPRIIDTVALLILCSSASLGAQEPEVVAEGTPRVRVSGSLGGGVGSYDFAGQLSLSLSTAAGDFILRTAGTEEFVIFSGPPQTADDLAVLYGRRASGSRGWVRAAAGPAWVSSGRHTDVSTCGLFVCEYEMETSSTLGLALQVDAVWTITRSFGLGVGGFADLNSGASFTGLTFNIHFGRLR
jgi:hypothetical protein